jgi:polyhydroxybutyrate depolymerase
MLILLGTGCSKATPSASSIAAKPAAVPSLASAGCQATPVPSAGERTISYDAAGEDGLYIEDIPPVQREHRPLPLVLDLHGYLETASLQNDISGLGAFGDAHGFITVTPQVNFSVQHWGVAPSSPDITYLKNLVKHVEHNACVDQHRVFFAGYSNGAWMTSVMACDLSSQVAAVATVAGLQDYSWCRPSRPVPVVAFHGTTDPFVAYQGGSGRAALSLPAITNSGTETGKTVGQELTTDSHTAILGPLPQAIPTQVAGWAHRNGCHSVAIDHHVADDVTLLSYHCSADGSVDFYRITGGGHAWPGSEVSASLASVIGHTTFSISADKIMWAFFEAHPLGSLGRRSRHT